jgi:hypothetical protein
VFVFLLFIPIVPTACQDGHPLETEDDTGIWEVHESLNRRPSYRNKLIHPRTSFHPPIHNQLGKCNYIFPVLNNSLRLFESRLIGIWSVSTQKHRRLSEIESLPIPIGWRSIWLCLSLSPNATNNKDYKVGHLRLELCFRQNSRACGGKLRQFRVIFIQDCQMVALPWSALSKPDREKPLFWVLSAVCLSERREHFEMRLRNAGEGSSVEVKSPSRWQNLNGRRSSFTVKFGKYPWSCWQLLISTLVFVGQFLFMVFASRCTTVVG